MASVPRSRPVVLTEVLTRQVDASPIVFFRVLFGILMAVEVIRYWAHGRISRYYIEPAFLFSFVEVCNLGENFCGYVAGEFMEKLGKMNHFEELKGFLHEILS